MNDFRLGIEKSFAEKGIVVAFPQLPSGQQKSYQTGLTAIEAVTLGVRKNERNYSVYVVGLG